MKLKDRKLIHTNEDIPVDIHDSHYSVTIYCTNCGQQDGVMVKKGVLKDSLTTKCTNCGCEVNL